MFWKTLTYFGDSMLLLPTAVIIALLLAWKSTHRWTWCYWLLAFGLAGALVSGSKILFLGFGFGSARLNFTGLSGHSAMSATLWPVMLWLLFACRSQGTRRLAIAVGYLLPLLVGVSRLVIHAHSGSEILGGLLLGFTLSSLFLYSQRNTPIKPFSWPQRGAVFIVPLLLISYGHIATTQQFLERFSAELAGLEKPYSRAELLHH